MAEKICIYRIYFPTNNKCYIGQTKDLKRRLVSHLRSGKLVCKALWKVNNWLVTVLHTCKTRDEVNRIEIEEIRNFNSVFPNGYNLTRGGEGNNHWKGKCLSEERKERIGQGLQGNQNGKGLKGYKHSKETKRKMSESLKGNKNGVGRSKESIQKGIETQRRNGTLKRSAKAKKKMQLAQLKRRIREMEQGGVA